jgi:urease accessory protein
MQARFFRAAFFALASALPLWAAAHTGADAGAHHPVGFLDGFLHPVTGPDHLAAMLAVGCWSALTARRIWLAPLAFAAMLLVGALMGLAGLGLPAMEPVIAASLLVLGLLVAARTQLPAAAAAALVGGFAIFHGVAHGAELAGDGNAWLPLAGMLLATVGLHLAGIGIGHALRQRNLWWPRVAGGIVTVLGAALLIRMV